MLKSLKETDYPYIVWLVTDADQAPYDYGTLDLKEKPKSEESGRLLKFSFSAAVIDGRHCHSRTVKLDKSEEPNTKWASHSIRVSLIKAAGSKLLIEHELLELSGPPNAVPGLVLSKKCMIVITKSLAQCKILGSSYRVSFDEAGTLDLAKDLVSWRHRARRRRVQLPPVRSCQFVFLPVSGRSLSGGEYK